MLQIRFNFWKNLSLILLALFATSACSSVCWNHPGREEYILLNEIEEPNNLRLIRDFTEFPIGKQIDVFLYAEACRKDPRFEQILARAGERIVPDIVRRIETEEHLYNKFLLVSVLTTINRECRCISRNSQVVEKLEAVGKELDEDKSIPDDYAYRRMYRDELNFLKSQNDNR